MKHRGSARLWGIGVVLAFSLFSLPLFAQQTPSESTATSSSPQQITHLTDQEFAALPLIEKKRIYREEPEKLPVNFSPSDYPELQQ